MARNKKQFPYVGEGTSKESLGIRERVLAIPSYKERVGSSKREGLLGVYLDMKERDYQVIGLLFLTAQNPMRTYSKTAVMIDCWQQLRFVAEI